MSFGPRASMAYLLTGTVLRQLVDHFIDLSLPTCGVHPQPFFTCRVIARRRVCARLWTRWRPWRRYFFFATFGLFLFGPSAVTRAR
jgi:hypothetical protein